MIQKLIFSIIILGLLSAGCIEKQNQTLSPDQIDDEINKVFLEVERLYGYSSDEKVAYHFITNDELQLQIAEFSKSFPEEASSIYAEIYSILDFVDKDSNLMHLTGDLYEEQTAGFYDPEANQLFIVNYTGQFGPMEKVNIAHEYTHALQDQRFDLSSFSASYEFNSDAYLALKALVEGDANRITFQFADNLPDTSKDQIISMVEQFDMPQLEAAPKVIREMLIFPGNSGIDFVMDAPSEEAIAEAFINPPRSTEQILHPEKYWSLDHFDEPQDIDMLLLYSSLAEDWKLMSEGWELQYSDVLGELGMRIYLSTFLPENTAESAAVGWDGDRFEYWKDSSGRSILAINSLWDDEQEAQEFFNCYADFIDIKTNFEATVEYADSNTNWWHSESSEVYACLDEQEVVLVFASDQDTIRRAIIPIYSMWDTCPPHLGNDVPHSEIVVFPDSNLDKVIREQIDKPCGNILKSELEQLTRLQIYDSPVKDFSGLEHCVNLTFLALKGGNITDISSLASLTNLTGLALANNPIQDITPLSNLTNLQELYLDEINVTDISALENLTNLSRLHIYDMFIPDICPLSNLTNLRELWLWKLKSPLSDISALASLEYLSELYLEGYQISDLTPLSKLSALSVLNLTENNVEDISPLAALTNLDHLMLSHNRIKDLSPLSHLFNLEGLSLRDNLVIDMSALSHLTQLEWLSLEQNQITDISSLSNIHGLTSLHLGENEINDISPLTSLVALENLDLSHNQITDISPLASLLSLKDIDLSHNQISDISSLAPLLSLEDVALSQNRIEDIFALISLPNLRVSKVYRWIDGEDVEVPAVDLTDNPLSETAVNVHIPGLESKDIKVAYSSP